jgi:hypothetical protein
MPRNFSKIDGAALGNWNDGNRKGDKNITKYQNEIDIYQNIANPSTLQGILRVLQKSHHF